MKLLERLRNSNQAGQAYALMVMTPIVPGQEQPLHEYFKALRDSGEPSPLSRLGRTHFGRWVIVPEFLTDPAQPRADPLGGPYLIFSSTFDGPLDSYLDELCTELAEEAREIWGRCVGCPPEASGPALKRYLLHNQIDTGLFVAAYPNAPVPKVRAALDTRTELAELAVQAGTMSPQELRQAFIARFAS